MLNNLHALNIPFVGFWEINSWKRKTWMVFVARTHLWKSNTQRSCALSHAHRHTSTLMWMILNSWLGKCLIKPNRMWHKNWWTFIPLPLIRALKLSRFHPVGRIVVLNDIFQYAINFYHTDHINQQLAVTVAAPKRYSLLIRPGSGQL